MLVDDRGRVGGRFNLVDVAAVVALFAVIPVVFGAYLLFRTPAPTLVSVSPAMVSEAPDQRVEVNGTNLRPFMRVSFDTIPAKTFLIGSTKYAVVDLPDLKPGVYDVVLYDYMHEVARLRRALSVTPIATDVELEVVGAFKSAPEVSAAQVKVGDKFPSAEHPLIEVRTIGPPSAGSLRLRVGDETVTVPLAHQTVAATLRVKCSILRAPDGSARCTVPLPDQRVVVAPDAVLTLMTPRGPLVFQIASARAEIKSR